jgi:hypothetical protein
MHLVIKRARQLNNLLGDEFKGKEKNCIPAHKSTRGGTFLEA